MTEFIKSQTALIEAFRKIDQDEVYLPSRFRYPLRVNDYLAWTEPNGVRTFLVFKENVSQKLFGVVFRVQTSPDSPALMCEWCHSVRSGDSVGLLTVNVNANRRFGLHLCRDLTCNEKFKETPCVGDLRETLSIEQKNMKLRERMSNFVRKNLF